MLTHLTVHNVVLIEKLDLDFSGGLTIFSGETGAGKSILLDSLGLVLGARGDTNLIRAGAEKLTVTATFVLDDKNSPFFQIINKNELTVEDEIIIRRTLSLDGRGKIFVNDQPISLKLLKELAVWLVEINGQFDTQGLLNPATHLGLLDAVGGLQADTNALKNAFDAMKNCRQNLKQAEERYQEVLKQEETLTYYKNELENAHIQKGEEQALTQKRQEMMCAEKITESFKEAFDALQGKGLSGNVRHALTALDRINRLTSDKYQEISNMLNSALVCLDEAVGQITDVAQNICYSQDDINRTEERLFALKALARKHQCTIDELPDVLNDISEKLLMITKNGDDITKLEKEYEHLKDVYLRAALALEKKRQTVAETLQQKVQKELVFLKMPKAVFKVDFCARNEDQWASDGIDDVSFVVSTNENTPFGPLYKIASGGELARFMLAVKVHLALNSNIETLIFDEIDSGVGGAVAQAVGQRLFDLAKHIQVFAVTHAPQVASFSQTHFKVEKRLENNTAKTVVVRLCEDAKKEEIARMLSGEIISDEARAAAEKLIANL